MIYQTMTPFSTFKFLQTQARRRKVLSEVMPVGENLAYFVVLSDAYLSVDEGEKHVRSFEDLRNAMECADSLQALQIARTHGKLTEGRHELPDVVAGYLAEGGEGSLHVRRWVFGVTDPVITTLPISGVKDAWSSSDFEEVEVCDSSGSWYFRARDDEPLIFLAVSVGPLSDQIKRCNEFCREVSGEFEYAP
jgi:hypothetical protein